MSFCAISIPDRKFFLIVFLFSFLWSFPQGNDSGIYRIKSVTVYGNKKTKERIILRELSRQVNDTLTLSALPQFKKRSEQNIFNTQLFIYDTIYPKINHSEKTIDLDIVVKERWYIWPVPVFEIQDRNFNTWWQT